MNLILGKRGSGKRSCLKSKVLAKLLPTIQNIYQITYIFCNTVASISVEPFDTILLVPRETLGLQRICRFQLLIHTTSTLQLTLRLCYKPLVILQTINKKK